MRKVFTAVTLFAAFLYAADPAREQTLQRAIDLMESKGDLAKAMPLFEDVSRSTDKALAARALLYLGQGRNARARSARVPRTNASSKSSAIRLRRLRPPTSAWRRLERRVCLVRSPNVLYVAIAVMEKRTSAPTDARCS